MAFVRCDVCRKRHPVEFMTNTGGGFLACPLCVKDNKRMVVGEVLK